MGTSREISRVFLQFETRSLSGGVHQWLKKIITREKYLRLEEMMTMIRVNKRKINPAENINFTTGMPTIAKKSTENKYGILFQTPRWYLQLVVEELVSSSNPES
jgi:hypothetical protein